MTKCKSYAKTFEKLQVSLTYTEFKVMYVFVPFEYRLLIRFEFRVSKIIGFYLLCAFIRT